MAEGFKVADAYVDLHVNDDTDRGRKRISSDNDKWAKKDGKKTGDSWAKGFLRGILGGLKVFGSILMKTALYSALVGVIGGAISGLAGYIVQLYAALGQLVVALWHSLGIFALLPGAIFAAITALMTLKLAFSGVGSAIKAGWSGDMEAYREALKKLSPEAKHAVQHILKLKPAITALKLAVQDSVFMGMGHTIRDLGAGFLPVLQRGLVSVGGGLNRILHNIAFGLLDSVTSVESALGHVGGLLQGIGDGLRPLIGGMLHFLDITLEVMNVGKVDNWLTSWGESLKALTSDDIRRWVDQSMGMLHLLGGFLADIGGIFAGLFRAAGDSKFGIFAWFEKVHQWIDDNQPLLSLFFGALKAAADALSPALFELMRQLTILLTGFAGVMVIIGPTLEVLFHVLGGALNSLLPLLGPALVVLGEVLIAALPAAQMLLQVLLPLLTAILPGLVPVFEALTPVLEPLIDMAKILGGAFADLFIALAPVLAELLKILVPVIGILVQYFADSVVALTPTLLALVPLLAQMAQELLPELLPILPELFEFFIMLNTVLLRMALQVLPILIPVLTWLLDKVIEPLIRIGLEPFKNIMQWLLDTSWSEVGTALAQPFKDAWHAAEDFANDVHEFVTGLPDKIVEWLGNGAGLLYDYGVDMIQGLIDGAGSLLSRLGSFLLDKLPGWLVEPFKKALDIHSPSGVFKDIGIDTMQGYIDGFVEQVPRLQQVLQGIATTLPASLNATLQAGVMQIQMNQPTPLFDVNVQIGERPVRDMVTSVVEQEPQLVSKSAQEGDRQRAFISPSRKRVGT